MEIKWRKSQQIWQRKAEKGRKEIWNDERKREKAGQKRETKVLLSPYTLNAP